MNPETLTHLEEKLAEWEEEKSSPRAAHWELWGDLSKAAVSALPALLQAARELERVTRDRTAYRHFRDRAERAERERDALVSALGRSYQTLKALGRNRQAVIRDLDETYAEIDAALGRVGAGEGEQP